ncbi:MAG: hypothetical protein Tsb009_37670 [Planctomycetaceae bacterium]
MTSNSDPWIGRSLSAGRYLVEKLLGKGGMGAVYGAKDTRLETKVVVKIPHKAMLANPDFVERIAREWSSLVKLRHPHVVQIVDVGEEEGTPFMVMPFLDGGSLNHRRTRDDKGKYKQIKLSHLKGWLKDVAKALDFIAQQNYVHRDIKPDNILFDKHKHVFVSDFGIAKLNDPDGAPQTDLTGHGIVGTPGYIAPEILEGKPCDGRADQYSLAITVYELLAGRKPYEGSTPAIIIGKQLSEDVPDLQKLRPGISRSIVNVLLRALHRNPEERFATCVAFVEALEKAIDQARTVRPQPSITGGQKSATAPPPIPATTVTYRKNQAGASAGNMPPSTIPIPAPEHQQEKSGGGKKIIFWLTFLVSSIVTAAVVAGLLGYREYLPEPVGELFASFDPNEKASPGKSSSPGTKSESKSPQTEKPAKTSPVVAAKTNVKTGVPVAKTNPPPKKPDTRKQIPPPPKKQKGTLVIRWPLEERQGAQIKINGKFLAIPADKTELQFSLKPGNHRIELLREGFKPIVENQWNILANQQKRLALNWEKIPIPVAKKKLIAAIQPGKIFRGTEQLPGEAAKPVQLTFTEIRQNGNYIRAIAQEGAKDNLNQYMLAVFEGSLQTTPKGKHYLLLKGGRPQGFSRKKSHLFNEYRKTLYFQLDTSGNMNGGRFFPFKKSPPIQLKPDGEIKPFPDPVKQVFAAVKPGTFWTGTIQNGIEIEKMTLLFTEIRNQGKYVRAVAYRDDDPFEIITLEGSLQLDDIHKNAYSIILQKKTTGSSRTLRLFSDSLRNLMIRVFRDEKTLYAYYQPNDLLKLTRAQPQPKTIPLDRINFAAAIRKACAPGQKWVGVLTNPKLNANSKLEVHFGRQDPNGLGVKVLFRVPGVPQGDVLCSGKFNLNDVAVNGYALTLKKDAGGLKHGKKTLFNKHKGHKVILGMSPDGDTLFGYIREPSVFHRRVETFLLKRPEVQKVGPQNQKPKK